MRDLLIVCSSVVGWQDTAWQEGWPLPPAPSLEPTLAEVDRNRAFFNANYGQGINLTIDQYTALIDILPDLERVLKSKGVTVPRPQYDKKSAPKPEDEEEEEEEEEETGAVDEGSDDAEAEASKHRGKLDRFKNRRNHEATSDEDEE